MTPSSPLVACVAAVAGSLNLLPPQASPHAIAALLKQFLLGLPEPLLTYRWVDNVLLCATSMNLCATSKGRGVQGQVLAESFERVRWDKEGLREGGKPYGF